MFSLLKEKNMINDQNYENHIDGPVIQLKSFNQYMFGVNTCPLPNPIWHYDDYNMFVDINDQKFIKVDKINNYFELIGDLESNEHKYILLNYYKFTNRSISSLPFNTKLNYFLVKFCSYLDSKKPKLINKPFLKILKKYFSNDYNKYKLVHYCDILNNTTVVINITNECKVNLVFGYGDIYSDGYININCIENYLDIIYNYLIEKLHKISPKDFVITNLTRVTGSSSFSKQLYSAYKRKNNFDINFNLIADNTVEWNSEQAKLKYIKKFKENNRDLFDTKLENINFKGFNYFFLNLDDSSLKNYKEKQRINDFYTNIVEELISSWEELYNDIK